MQAAPGQQPIQYEQPVQYSPQQTMQQPAMQQQVMQQPVMQQPVMQQQGAMVVAGGGGGGPDTLVAYLLWFFLGIFGVHHLYIGRGVGILLVSLITFQGLGFWWLIDLFLIPGSCASRRNGGMVVIR